jgi:hypothetical protein
MSNDKESCVGMARRAWGEAAPEWVTLLAQACDASTQSAVARRLGVSSAMINTALKKTYTGRLDRLETRVRGELMNERVRCPVLGEITKRKCMDAQARPYKPTNALRIELRRTCPACPNAMQKDAA